MSTEIEVKQKQAEQFDANNETLEELRLVKARVIEIEQDIAFLQVSKMDIVTQQMLAENIRELANRVSNLENEDLYGSVE